MQNVWGVKEVHYGIVQVVNSFEQCMMSSTRIKKWRLFLCGWTSKTSVVTYHFFCCIELSSKFLYVK